MLLGIQTREKLLSITEHKMRLEFDNKTMFDDCILVLMLHKLVEIFNVGMKKSMRLKVYDITLHQKRYKEYKKIVIADSVWDEYISKHNTGKEKPNTRKELMGAIFSLSEKVFGSHSTNKKKTDRRNHSKKYGAKKRVPCYNYACNPAFLSVHVGLADWSKRDLLDIEPAVVAAYGLKQRQQCDHDTAGPCTVRKCPLCPLDSRPSKQKEKNPPALVGQKRQKQKVQKAKPHAAQHAKENNNEKTVKMTTLYDKIPITAQARPNIMPPVVRPTL